MEKRQLGRSDVQISPIIFGAWAIGGWMWGGTDEQESIAAIQAGIDEGINTIDTAAIYGMGLSEELVGKAIKGRRDKFVIATKCGLTWEGSEGVDPWIQTTPEGKQVVIRKNCKPASIVKECENSLKRLGVNVIDLYQIHWPDPSTPIEDAWQTMVKLKEQGKVKAIGVSNYTLEQLQQAQSIHPIDSLQPPYSLIRRNIEDGIVSFCLQNKISIIAYSPLERGLLTGKVTLDRKFEKGDHRATHPYFSTENRKTILEALEKIKPIAEKNKATLSQIMINCTIHRPGITGAIVGARNPAQARENAKSASLSISSQDREFIIDTLSLAMHHLAEV